MAEPRPLRVATALGSSRFALTVAEYLRREEDSPVKHEYVAGEVYAGIGLPAVSEPEEVAYAM